MFMKSVCTTACALKFKKITVEDIHLIDSMLQVAYSRTCDYSVGGIMMWVDYFDYEYCIVEDTLFIKGRTEDNLDETAFMLPIGALPTGEAVRMILDYCSENGISPVFSAVPEDRLDALLTVMEKPEIETLGDWSDYIYDIHALASMSGKKLSKKRNHFNRFVNLNPGWRLETIMPSQLDEVRAFFENIEPDGESDLALYEYDQCRRVLEDYRNFPFEGALLRGKNGGIAAFAVGEVVGDTLFVHIEKINHDMEGAGATICKLFSEYMLMRHPGLRYVNREEDCGDPGLRTAKEQYYPAAVLNKFNVREG